MGSIFYFCQSIVRIKDAIYVKPGKPLLWSSTSGIKEKTNISRKEILSSYLQSVIFLMENYVTTNPTFFVNLIPHIVNEFLRCQGY